MCNGNITMYIFLDQSPQEDILFYVILDFFDTQVNMFTKTHVYINSNTNIHPT